MRLFFYILTIFNNSIIAISVFMCTFVYIKTIKIMKGLKEIKLDGTESAIFHFQTCEIWCDFVAEWEEKEWTETLHDPYCEISHSSKELTYLEITYFDIEGSEIRFYKEKHKEFEELLYQILID